ncbi:MAG TPA: primosomal replication protein N [Castellaniella sp.]|nr:primosomal replication protein N [Castellaniella sp.]
MNRLELSARVIAIDALRHTPAGVPVLHLQLAHESELIEAGLARRIELEVPAVALGEMALLLSDTELGRGMDVEGFLAPSRKGSNKLVLHIRQASRHP